MGDELWDWISRIGEPRPCDLCRMQTPPAELEERFMPGSVVFNAFGVEDWTLTVRRLYWLCARCAALLRD